MRVKAIFGLPVASLLILGVIASTSSAEGFWELRPLPSPVALPSPTAAPASTQGAAGPPASPSSTASPSGSPSLLPLPGIRDLSLYENGGVISIAADSALPDVAFLQARTFLLRKWNTRSPGRISLMSITPSGQQRTKSFFVERDPAGIWKITIEMQNSEPTDFYFVQEIGVTASGRPILPPSAGVSASRALHLKPDASAKHGIVL